MDGIWLDSSGMTNNLLISFFSYEDNLLLLKIKNEYEDSK